MSVYLKREELRDSGLVGTVALGTYGVRGGALDRRHVEDARGRFTAACKRLGFAHDMRLEGTGTRQDVMEGIRRFLDHAATRKILYWTGHGHDAGRHGYVLGCGDSYPDGPEPDVYRAVPFTELLQKCAAEQDTDLLLVIDACQSQSPLAGSRLFVEAHHEQQHQHRRRDSGAPGPMGAGRGLVIAATAGRERTMEEGRWVDWLDEVLADRNLQLEGLVRPFDPTALYLPVPHLLEAIDRRAAASGLDDPELRPRAVEVRSLDIRFLHNPHFEEKDVVFRTAVQPPDHEPWLRADHFGPVAGGSPAHRFTGRVRPLSRLVTWLESGTRGMLVVTGPAGTGKTALLARLALLSVPRIREGLRPPPPPQTRPRAGSVHAALACQGESPHSLARSLLEVLVPLGAVPPGPDGSTPEQCVRQVRELVRRVGGLNLVVDSLDEAMPGQAHEIARRLLNPLSHCPGVKLVVGTRPQPRQVVDGASKESLVDALDRSAPDLALDRDKDTESDIATLVETLLAAEGSPYAGPDADAVRWDTAARVAARCGGRFLVARLVARALARRTEPLSGRELDAFIDTGGGELQARMEDELDVLDPNGRGRAAELLLPLALVQGVGLADRGLWLRMANALRRPRSKEILPRALETVLRQTEDVLVTAEHRPGRPVAHRLDHAGYGTALLARARLSPAAAHRRVFDELYGAAYGDWDRADAYTLAHLGAHAAQARTDTGGPEEDTDPLEELFADPGFLVRTEPDVMLPLAAPLAATCDGAALYRRVGARFKRRTEPAQRRAMLRAEAFVSHPEIFRGLADLPEFAGQPWDEVWTDLPPEPLELSLPAPLGGARALSWTAADGGTIAVAGRGEIAVRRADTGGYVRTVRTGEEGHGRRAVLTEVRESATRAGRFLLAHDGRSLHLWSGDERLPRRTYHWGGRIDSLALARCGDAVQAVVADGHCVWGWRWPSGGGPAAEARSDVLPIRASRVALLGLRDRGFLLTAARTVTLHELHGKPAGEQPLVRWGRDLRAPGQTAFDAAALPDGDEHGWLAVADGDTAEVWRLSAPGYTTEPTVASRLTVRTAAREIALGHHGERPLLALHEGSTVRVLEITDPSCERSFELSSQRNGLAFDPLRTGRLAVGDGDEVRLLDVPAAAGHARAGRRRDHDQRPVVGLTAAGRGAPALLSRVWGNTVRVTRQDARAGATGAALALDHDDRVTAVSALWCEDHWTLAAASGRRVHLWRLAADLTGHERDGHLTLGGNRGEQVPGLGLVAADGGPELFVPVGRRVERFARAEGTWRRTGGVEAADVKVRGVGARTAGEHTWVLADCGDSLSLWRSTPDGFAAAGRRAAGVERPAGAVLGTGHLDGAYVPLVAWARGDYVHLARCADGHWTTDSSPSPHGTPTALAFAGPPRRPLLLAFGGEGTVAVRDVADGTWRDELAVPYRGLEVAAADAVHDTGPGITLALQGRGRCDQIRLPERLVRGAPRPPRAR
ncbi:AAA family ATPase [Streptomyces sp. NPDC127033]|uniref:AAA family ATPase n=1 Tax=Streptomyces sp. NPDC127033 TaxID=3347110 RepID=UPI00365C05EC